MAAPPAFEERQWLFATFGGAACVVGCVVGIGLLLWAAVVFNGIGVWIGLALLIALLAGMAAFVLGQRLAMRVGDGTLQVDSGKRRLLLPVTDIVAVEVVEPGVWTNLVTGKVHGPSDRLLFPLTSFGPTWAPVNIPRRNVFSVAGYGMVRIVTREREIWIRSFRPNQLQVALCTAAARAGLNP